MQSLMDICEFDKKFLVHLYFFLIYHIIVIQGYIATIITVYNIS